MLSNAPRWLFAAIPLGFVALVGLMILLGERTGGPTTNPYASGDILKTSQSPELNPEIVNDPDDVQEPFVPTPSGPEFDDNETIIE